MEALGHIWLLPGLAEDCHGPIVHCHRSKYVITDSQVNLKELREVLMKICRSSEHYVPTVEACFRELRLFILWVPLRAKTVFRTQKDLKHWSDDSFWTASSIPLTPLSGFTHEI